MDSFESLLRSNGLQITESRKLIYRVLMENKYSHLDAKEILDLARKEDRSIGMATIYRNLDLLINLGIVTTIGDKFELKDNDRAGIHPHFICSQCNKVTFVGEPLPIDEDLIFMAKDNDFSVENINLKILGLCEDCKEKNKK